MAMWLLVLFMAGAMADLEELPEDCAAEALELRQLRGERRQVKEDAETCGDWLDRDECDEDSEVAADESIECADECSHDVCCKTKAACNFFTAKGGCAGLTLPANVTGKVWAQKTQDPDEFFSDMFCASTEQSVESCGEACCEMKPCQKCSGQTYTEGCKAGFTGTCAACPKAASCAAGQMQSCGDGILSACKPCSNAPAHAHYTGTAMDSECPWVCNDEYLLHEGKCVPSICETWNGTCDAATTIPRAAKIPCKGFCTSETCCAPKATCGSYLGASTSSDVPSAQCAAVKDATSDGKVWAPLEASAGTTLYCKGTESDDSSCQKACCSEQSCKTCSGKFYTDKCQAGTIGTCAACPTSTSCSAGEYQTCGDGALSKCLKCSNAPENSAYSEGSLSSECPWKCNEGYVKSGTTCVATCALYSCDAASSIPLKASTLCNGTTCSSESCCTPKATCGSYIGASSDAPSAKCAAVKDAASNGKVWAPMEASAGTTLYCKGTESDDSSCQKACCAAQSCKTCSGKLYNDGCQAGSIGVCSACPTNTSCAAGEYQTCGDGVLSKCQTCSNAPKNSVYTDTEISWSSTCPWKCSEGYVQSSEGPSKCLATCSIYTCSKAKALAPIPNISTKVGADDEACCQDIKCNELATKTALPDSALEQGGCKTVKNQTECDSKYVVSGNQHASGAGATIYTACTWDASQDLCNWDYHAHRNCVF